MKQVSGRDFCRIIQRHGWVHTRTRGSHHIHKKPGVPLALSVPIHGNRPLDPRLQRGLMKQAGITESDL